MSKAVWKGRGSKRWTTVDGMEIRIFADPHGGACWTYLITDEGFEQDRGRMEGGSTLEPPAPLQSMLEVVAATLAAARDAARPKKAEV